jgi:hypothetical protein
LGTQGLSGKNRMRAITRGSVKNTA